MKSKLVFCLLAIVISLIDVGCQMKYTHVYGQVSDEQKTGISNVKVVAISISKMDSSKIDTLQTVYTNDDGNYAVNIDNRKRYRNVQLVNPYRLNPQLVEKYKNADAYKGHNIVTDCCKVVVGQANHLGFVVKK